MINTLRPSEQPIRCTSALLTSGTSRGGEVNAEHRVSGPGEHSDGAASAAEATRRGAGTSREHKAPELQAALDGPEEAADVATAADGAIAAARAQNGAPAPSIEPDVASVSDILSKRPRSAERDHPKAPVVPCDGELGS